MGYKQKGWSPFTQDSRRLKKAKRLVRKNVHNAVEDAPNSMEVDNKDFIKSDKKINKAEKLLKKEGYTLGQREQMTGATGYDDAMAWSQSSSIYGPDEYDQKNTITKNGKPYNYRKGIERTGEATPHTYTGPKFAVHKRLNKK